MKKMVCGVMIGALAVASAGCMDKQVEPWHDSGINGRDDSAAEIVNMPDGFSNLADKCVHGSRIFVAYKGDENRAAIAVVPNDPSC